MRFILDLDYPDVQAVKRALDEIFDGEYTITVREPFQGASSLVIS